MEGLEEANMAAMESCSNLVALLSQSRDPFHLRSVVAKKTDEAISRFNKVVTMLSNRVGHARARVGNRRSPPPVDPICLLDHPCHSSLMSPRNVAASRVQKEVVAPCAKITSKFDRNMFLETTILELNASKIPSTSLLQNSSKCVGLPAAAAASATSATHIQFQQQKMQQSYNFDKKIEKFQIEMPRSSANEINFSFDNSVCTSSAATSFFTSLSIDRSRARSEGQDFQLISLSDATNSALPSKKVRVRKGDDENGKCHCPKKRKLREKRVVRVPAISERNADIPPDNYSWRKYGQKPIKGSPHPRGYYRCSSKKDCPARKHVERCRNDPVTLIVTYENEHNHAQPLDLSVQTVNIEA